MSESLLSGAVALIGSFIGKISVRNFYLKIAKTLNINTLEFPDYLLLMYYLYVVMLFIYL